MAPILKAAVIGAGIMGSHHARLCNDLDKAGLQAVADSDPKAAEAVSRRHKVPAFSDYREMLDEIRPDFVIVAVPTSLHYPVAKEVIQRKIPVLVEKPISTNVKDARALVECARSAGVKLAVGHLERFNPAVAEVKDRLIHGQLGRIFEVHARRLSPFPPRIIDMGVTVDLATHDIDVMRYLLGSEAARVFAETERKAAVDHEDLLSGLIRFKNGVIGVLNVNWLTPTKIRQLTITGERGMFVVDYLTQDLSFYQNSAYTGVNWSSPTMFQNMIQGDLVKLPVRKQEPLRLEVESFVDCVVNDRTPRVTGEDGLATLQLAHSLVQSGAAHTTISLN